MRQLLIFQFLIAQYFVIKYKDIILKCSITFLRSTQNGKLKYHNTASISSKLYCRKKQLSFVCDFYKDIVNKEQLHSKIQQFLASNDLHSPTPNAVLKLFVEIQTLANLLPCLMCLLCVFHIAQLYYL